MVDVYKFIPVNEVENAVECGLKLSKWYDREVAVAGEKKKCLAALLNPKDEMYRYKSAEYKCIKLELAPNYCFVADRYLYFVALNHPEIMERYEKSIIPVDQYTFGSYRLPECLVTSTIIAGQASILDRRLDLPILIANSEELYINNIIETHREEQENFNDLMLYCYYDRLVQAGRMDKVEDQESGVAVFIDNEKQKVYTIKWDIGR